MYTVKYCKICKEDLPNPYCIPEYFIRCLKPKEHNISQFVDTGLSENDYDIITKISDDISFLEAMISLKEKDIIEYNLKMSQFRNQAEQQQSAKSVEDNAPKCPKCNSTNIQMITRKWSILTGFMTNKVDRVCVNCKHRF